MASALTSESLPLQLRPRLSALLEVLAVIVVFYALHVLLRVLDLGVAVGTLAILPTLALATWLLGRRRLTWSAIGFTKPPSVRWLAGWTVALFLAEMAAPLVVQPLVRAFDLPPQDLSLFTALKGNTTLYLVMLIPVSWGMAAFGEELLYRGFINSRLTDALGGTTLASGLAILFQALLFASGHAYLGARGILNAGVLALVAGVGYLACGRNLWPLILAHALVDSFAMTMLYLGLAQPD
jgi:membrane protease YdiL (CAAX protease family)